MIKSIGTTEHLLKTNDHLKWQNENSLDMLTKDEGVKSRLHLSENMPLDVAQMTDPSQRKTFSEFLSDSLLKVNSLQKDANMAIQELVTGRSQNLHETMMMVEKAGIAFKTMNQVRQKVLDAYREVMKIQM